MVEEIGVTVESTKDAPNEFWELMDAVGSLSPHFDAELASLVESVKWGYEPNNPDRAAAVVNRGNVDVLAALAPFKLRDVCSADDHSEHGPLCVCWPQRLDEGFNGHCFVRRNMGWRVRYWREGLRRWFQLRYDLEGWCASCPANHGITLIAQLNARGCVERTGLSRRKGKTWTRDTAHTWTDLYHELTFTRLGDRGQTRRAIDSIRKKLQPGGMLECWAEKLISLDRLDAPQIPAHYRA